MPPRGIDIDCIVFPSTYDECYVRYRVSFLISVPPLTGTETPHSICELNVLLEMRKFKNYAINEFCAKKGIKREFSVARTPQQNGVAERKNKTLIEAARTMLADRKYPLSKDACQVMLKMKLLDRTMDEVCYQLLMMIEKQYCTKALATPEQTATGKEISNPLIADSLLKTIRLSMHLSYIAMLALTSPGVYGSMVKTYSNPLMARRGTSRYSSLLSCCSSITSGGQRAATSNFAACFNIDSFQLTVVKESMGNSNDHPQPPVSISSVKDFPVLTAIGAYAGMRKDLRWNILTWETVIRFVDIVGLSSGMKRGPECTRGSMFLKANAYMPYEIGLQVTGMLILPLHKRLRCDELLENWKDSEFSMLPTYKELIVAGYKILVFGGDTVSVVPVTATRFSLSYLNLTVNTEWYPWCSDSDYDSRIERAIAKKDIAYLEKKLMDQSHGVDAKSRNPFDFPSDTDLDPSNNATCPNLCLHFPVHYVGSLLDGTRFDSSFDRMMPFKFKLGLGKIDYD
ncbi:serine carboxypeptidase 24-like protein [Tanacetum coccineum]|uniref:peptidylprolyl isomerase n=1 Tax=Tanacetum coccineum TaxID=301880 RepID=A0ABQ5E8M1_9ASTR